MTNSTQHSKFGGPQFHPLSIARVIWKRKFAVLAGWVLLTAGASYVIYQLPNVYRAEALILVDSQKIPEKFVASTVEVSLQDTMNAINKQVLSGGRLQDIINEFGLYSAERKKKSVDEIIELMRSNLHVTLERNLSGTRGGACRISFEGPNPAVVAGVVSRVTDIFVDENARTRQQRAQGASTFIEDRLAEAKASLDKQETNLSEYKVRWAGELPQQEASLLGALSRLQDELEGTQQAINRAEQNKMMLETTLTFSEASLEAADRAKTQLADSRRPSVEVAPAAPAPAKPSDTLRQQLDRLRLRYAEDHPEVKRARAELNQAIQEEQKALAARPLPGNPDANSTPAAARRGAQTTPAVADGGQERQRVLTSKAQLDLVVKEIAERSADRQRILKEMSDYQARVDRLPLREQQIAALTRDYEASKANYRSLLDKKISAEMSNDMEKGNQSERFTVADRARQPVDPARPRRRLLCAISALGALILSLVAAVLLGLKKNDFLGEWELPAGVIVLGRISRIQAPATSARVQAILCWLAVSAALRVIAVHYLGNGI